MTTPTDLRAALRGAANALARVGLRRDADLIAELRAISDAPPTVAELLPLVDETHEVRWSLHGEERRAINAGGDSIWIEYRSAIEYRAEASRWFDASLTVADLAQPATLVEVPRGR